MSLLQRITVDRDICHGKPCVKHTHCQRVNAMIADSILTEEQLIQQATEALMSKLGLVETLRFLALTTHGRVESVERHRAWQATLDREAFFDQVFDEASDAWSIRD